MTGFSGIEGFLAAGDDRMDLTGACLAVCSGVYPDLDFAAGAGGRRRPRPACTGLRRAPREEPVDLRPASGV